MSALGAQRILLASTHFIRAQRGKEDSDLRAGERFEREFVETRVGHRVSKESFEPAGSTRFHLDGLKGLVP